MHKMQLNKPITHNHKVIVINPKNPQKLSHKRISKTLDVPWNTGKAIINKWSKSGIGDINRNKMNPIYRGQQQQKTYKEGLHRY